MRVFRANHLGMCFGVRDAIKLAQSQAALQPITILGELVHNEDVLADLKQRGVRVARTPDSVETSVAMITAHGASDALKTETKHLGLSLVDATCPLVKSAHKTLVGLVNRGFHPVVVGQRDHVEVRGLTGDLDEFDVVLTAEETRLIPSRPRFGVVAQTTQPIARVRGLVDVLRITHPQAEVEFIDTVCQPTKLRQKAAEDLAADCDVVVVVGGANSNNTRELVRTSALKGARVHHVQHAEDLEVSWFEGAANVGLTAGTSTPDNVIDAVEAKLMMWSQNASIPVSHHAAMVTFS